MHKSKAVHIKIPLEMCWNLGNEWINKGNAERKYSNKYNSKG